MTVLDTFNLKDRVALMTGGNSQFGRQIVEALAEAGAEVMTTSRDKDSLSELCNEWRKRGLSVTPAGLDQADEASILALREFIVSEHGRLDVLVNNAVLRPMGDWESAPEQFGESMAANATGLMMITRALGSLMADQGKGSIINIGSIQGMVAPDYSLYEGLGWGSPPDYFFHKGGMLNFTRYVASRLGPHGVRCNTISPGGFFSNQDPKFVERYSRRTALGRMANDSDLKGAIVFLASDASAYVTGANLVVDAGYTAI